jgi:putative ABC transport system ATP-binding protein
MEKAIELKNVTKIYQDGGNPVVALKDVSLEVKEGEFIAIVGPSGSGKSTLMNIIGCLDKVTKGEYYLEGINVENLSDDELAKIRNKKIGFVFQAFNLLSRLSAVRNVELPLLYSGIPQSIARVKAIKALKDVGLFHRINHFPNQLSGGEKQRVAIARALINNPSLILADEPTGNLDTKTGYEIMEIFKKLNYEGVTIILITHEREIANYSRRIIKLRDGKII